MKIALFREHKHDLLCGIISAETRGIYCHAAVVTDPATRTIVEAFYPAVRKRTLDLDELPGVDFFDVAGLDDEKAAGILQYCQDTIGAKARYSVANLLRFSPELRVILGEAQDADCHASVFCSQFVMDCFERGAGLPLLRAHSWEVAPSQLTWSPLLIPSTL